MPDVMSKKQRSRLMSLVRCRNTRFELTFLQVLSAELYPFGFRYRKHHRPVCGTPDVVFVKYKLAIFLDSDFWHGRNYDKMAPRMNSFWRGKIERNMERDRQVNRQLRREGWTVLRFGEKEVKKYPYRAVGRAKAALFTLRQSECEISRKSLRNSKPVRSVRCRQSMTPLPAMAVMTGS
jgi:DNA mismatch endonuclease, patch repair protein